MGKVYNTGFSALSHAPGGVVLAAERTSITSIALFLAVSTSDAATRRGDLFAHRMDATLPAALLERYPHHRATLQRLDALDQRIDDLERRVAVRRAARGTPGLSAAARAAGTLRVWCSHTSGTRPCTQPSPKKRKKDDSAGDETSWELTIDGKVIDDGCDGHNQVAADARTFGDLVDRVEISLDRKQGKGSTICWRPAPRDRRVDGVVLSRAFKPGAKASCLVRVAVFARRRAFDREKVRLSPSLQKLMRVAREEETRDNVLRAISRYADVKHLRDLRDGKQIQCDAVLQAALGVPSFVFTQLDDLLQPHLLVPEPQCLDLQLAVTDSAVAPVFMDVPVDVPIRRPVHVAKADGDHRPRDLEVLLADRAAAAWAAHVAAHSDK